MNRFNFGKKNNDKQKGDLVPFGGFGLLEGFDLDTLVEDFFRNPFGAGFFKGIQEPALDVYEKENRVVVKAELPGLDKKDINVRLDGDVLTLSGRRSAEKEVKKENYYYLERSIGNVQRSVRLPEGIKQDSVKANYKDGVLTIELNRDKEVKKGKDVGIE